MIKPLLFFLFVFAFALGDTLSVGWQKENEKTTIYSVQLFAEKSVEKAKKRAEKISDTLKNEITLHGVGGYFVGRYGQDESYGNVKQNLKIIHQAGYADAYIIESTSWDMKNNLVSSGTNEAKKEIAKNANSAPELSKFNRSDILLKAQKAYQSGDETGAMLYYEMLLASGYENQKIKNNLCYLYGKKGAWFQAKNIIDSQNYQGKLLYAYAYGALEGNQESFYNDLLPYISIDGSGRLMMLSGYYFEKKDDMQRALSFYKMAYEKNPNDVYNIFSYARALDLEQNTQARGLYNEILKKIDNSHPLYATIQKRSGELGE